jgi:hypothetical protein
MEQFLMLLGSIVVPIVVNKVKLLKSIEFSSYQKSIVRFSAGVLSFGVVILSSWGAGTDVDVVSVQTLWDTVQTFALATTAWLVTKK